MQVHPARTSQSGLSDREPPSQVPLQQGHQRYCSTGGERTTLSGLRVSLDSNTTLLHRQTSEGKALPAYTPTSHPSVPDRYAHYSGVDDDKSRGTRRKAAQPNRSDTSSDDWVTPKILRSTEQSATHQGENQFPMERWQSVRERLFVARRENQKIWCTGTPKLSTYRP